MNYLVHIFLMAPAVRAAESGFDLIGKVTCADRGDCTIQEIVAGFGILMNWAVSISGAIALLMFIIGGIYMLASAGRAEWVKRGKAILVNTSIALFFIFSSWLIVNFIVKALVTDSNFLLEPGFEQANTNTTPNLDLACQNAASDGVPCGGSIANMFCHNQRCVTGCAYKYKGNTLRYDCNPVSACGFPAGGTCSNSTNCDASPNLCPPNSFFTDRPTEQHVCCYPL